MKIDDFEIVHENDNIVTFTDENGNEELYQIIFTLESVELNKRYAVFTKVFDLEAASDDDDIDVGAAEIIDGDGAPSLIPIETEEEWQLITDGLMKFDQEFDQEYDEEDETEAESDYNCEKCDHKYCHVDEKNNEVCECDGDCQKSKK